jgi:membrane protease YdiL (CAAX protease family)
MDMPITRTSKRITVMIYSLTILFPILFFITIKVFNLSGLPLYFAQIGLYALFFVLAFWGIKQSQISLSLSGQKVVAALSITLACWLIYALIISGTGIIRLADEVTALRSVEAWKVWAQIVSTWLFVGIGEEVLFRGYFLKKLLALYENKNAKRAMLLAVVVSSALFSVWHLPVRIFSLINGEMGIGLILISLVMLFLLGAGFAWLFIRSGSILLVGLIHGVMDYPLIGKDSQLSFFILIAAIGLTELVQWVKGRKSYSPKRLICW